MDLVNMRIIVEAIRSECKYVTNIYHDPLYNEIIVDPINKGRSTKILSIEGRQVTVCSGPGWRLVFDIAVPNSFAKIAEAIDMCISQHSCYNCEIVSESQ